MRRKANTLISIEVAILGASIDFARSGETEFHGYAMAKQLRDDDADRRLTAHGTLYRALERLEKLGLLTSRWEDPADAAAEHRPLRRLYRITATGERAHAEALQTTGAAQPSRLDGRLAPS